MAFRGFVDKKSLKFSTDLRSTKVTELKYNSNVELCWYFADSKEQFRVSGKAEVVTCDISPLAFDVFSKELTDSARATFAWPHPAVGQLTIEVSEEEYPERLYPRELLCPPSFQHQELYDKALRNFGLMLVTPTHISHVQLVNNHCHQYFLHDEKMEWLLINPNIS
eukprot:TRINITY_DN1427_c0_g2_i2.p1 TRINITY_DN1427_c0_g2~~TRINITY_DN1427_c0_g2_i2.p1  ORF type:complete len:166 (-),score=26.71 TRINITY_DN1427_c0_g2_i2:100-597(-)